MQDMIPEHSPSTLELHLRGEVQDRISDGRCRLPFGVQYLDDCCGGIISSDLILIGAYSGGGKSELANIIASTNARNCKRVHFFALEAEPREVERRMKYRLLIERIHKAGPYGLFERMTYLDWRLGKYADEVGHIEKSINVDLVHDYSNLHTFYPKDDFTIEALEATLWQIKDQTDLIIIDHLHYFDFDTRNENASLKNIIKRTRNIALLIGKPVILLAQLRKKDRRDQSVTPSIDDFHGSSDVPKIATKIITLARCNDETLNSTDKRATGTFFRVAKLRMDGSRTDWISLVRFSHAMNAYSSKYMLGRLINNATEVKWIADHCDAPIWAHHISYPAKKTRTGIGGKSSMQSVVM